MAVPGVPLPSRKPFDGHDYIPQALAKGAVAVVGMLELNLPVPYLRVADARAALADLSAAFWGYPAQKLKLVGVTGSKGKTTVTVLLHHLLQSASPPVGRLSTVGVKIGDEALFCPATSPPPRPRRCRRCCSALCRQAAGRRCSR